MSSTFSISPQIGDVVYPSKMSAELTHALHTAGFFPTPSETWGRVMGEVTAFLDIGAEGTLAWLFNPEQLAFVGPRLHVAGAPDTAAPEAVRQLMLVLQSHEVSGSEAVSLDNAWESANA